MSAAMWQCDSTNACQQSKVGCALRNASTPACGAWLIHQIFKTSNAADLQRRLIKSINQVKVYKIKTGSHP